MLETTFSWTMSFRTCPRDGKGKPGEHYILGGENVSLKQLFELIDELSGKSISKSICPPGSLVLFPARTEKAKWFAVKPYLGGGPMKKAIGWFVVLALLAFSFVGCATQKPASVPAP